MIGMDGKATGNQARAKHGSGTRPTTTAGTAGGRRRVKTPWTSELLPDYVQGWYLLQDAGLTSHERNVVQTAIQGDFSMARVAQELRSQCAVLDGAKKDYASFKNTGYLGDLPEEMNEEDGDGPPLDDDLEEEEQIMWSEAEGEAQEAMAAIQAAKNTLRQARMKQRNVKMSRQYFRARTTTQERSGAAPRDDSKMTCLRCGRVGHRMANCPDPPAAAKVSDTVDASSSFICFNETQQALSAGISTAEAVRQGKAVIDGGATKTLASVAAMEHIMALNARKLGSSGVKAVDLKDRPTFGFGNGSENRCTSTVQLQVQANTRPGELKVHCLNQGSGPLLLSVEALRRLKAVIDFDADLICFRALDDKRLIKAERSQTGHQLLPLCEDLYKDSMIAKSAIPSLEEFVNS